MTRFELYKKDEELKIQSKCSDCIRSNECIIEDPTDVFIFIPSTIHCKNFLNKKEK